jgi:hypothetical protein
MERIRGEPSGTAKENGVLDPAGPGADHRCLSGIGHGRPAIACWAHRTESRIVW